MNSFEINKVISSIIIVVLVVIGVNKLADVIYNVKAPKSSTYKMVIKTKEISKDDTTKVESVVNIKAFLALGSIDEERWYLKSVLRVIQYRKVEVIK